MTSAQLGKIWSFVSLALLYYALSSYIVTQGGEAIFGDKLVSMHRAPAAVIAIPICTVLLIITSLVGWLFARRAEGKWHARVPVVGFDSLVTGARESQIYQATMLFFFSAVPALSLIHFWDIFQDETVVFGDGCVQDHGGVWNFAKRALAHRSRICSTHDSIPSAPGADLCVGGGDIYPFYEPFAFAVLTAVAGAAVLLHWWTVFKRRSPAPAG